MITDQRESQPGHRRAAAAARQPRPSRVGGRDSCMATRTHVNTIVASPLQPHRYPAALPQDLWQAAVPVHSRAAPVSQLLVSSMPAAPTAVRTGRFSVAASRRSACNRMKQSADQHPSTCALPQHTWYNHPRHTCTCLSSGHSHLLHSDLVMVTCPRHRAMQNHQQP